ncbi:MAG: DUF488 family protein [Bacteroidota bacterium]
MFYRRKVILALLESLGGELRKTDFQKHLFLFTRSQEEPVYDFVPYKYGSFSFGADADREPMIRSGFLHDGLTWRKKTKTSYVSALKPDDQRRIIQHVGRFGHLRGRDLIREVYTTYPYYAVRSQIAREVLNNLELERVAASEPPQQESALLTIGYEGQSLEAYLNKLVRHRVSVLCDVRRNPISRKFGFSKRQLKGAAESLGIRYVHIPELGIASGKRKALSSSEEYAQLFDRYEKETLSERGDQLDRIYALLQEHGRVALTCFEACHTDCHRSRVADALQRLPLWKYPVLHV